MSAFPVAEELAAGLVRKYWEALRDCPNTEAGWKRLAEVLREVAASVDHARYIARAFPEFCPRPGDIESVANASRHRFEEPEPDQVEKWKAEGATNEPLEFLDVRPGENKDTYYERIRWDSIQSALEKTRDRHLDKADRLFWPEWLAQMEKNHPDEVAVIRSGGAPPHKARAPVAAIPPRLPKAPPPLERPFTPDDLTAAPRYEPKAYDTPRCEHCDGTGRTDSGAYCQCDTGRALSRQIPIEDRLDLGRYSSGNEVDEELRFGEESACSQP